MSFTVKSIHTFIDKCFPSYEKGYGWLKKVQKRQDDPEKRGDLFNILRQQLISDLAPQVFPTVSDPNMAEIFDALINNQDPIGRLIDKYCKYRKQTDVKVLTCEGKIFYCSRKFFSKEVRIKLKTDEFFQLSASEKLYVQCHGRYSWEFVKENQVELLKLASQSYEVREHLYNVWLTQTSAPDINDKCFIECFNFFTRYEEFRSSVMFDELAAALGLNLAFRNNQVILVISSKSDNTVEALETLRSNLKIMKNVVVGFIDFPIGMERAFEIMQASRNVVGLELQNFTEQKAQQALEVFIRQDTTLRVLSGDLTLTPSLVEALSVSETLEEYNIGELNQNKVRYDVSLTIRNKKSIDQFLEMINELAIHDQVFKVFNNDLLRLTRGQICKNFRILYECFYKNATPQVMRKSVKACLIYSDLLKNNPNLSKPFTLLFLNVSVDANYTKEQMSEQEVKVEKQVVLDQKIAGIATHSWEGVNSYLFYKDEYEDVILLLRAVTEGYLPQSISKMITLLFYAKKLNMHQLLKVIQIHLPRRILESKDLAVLYNAYILLKDLNVQDFNSFFLREHLFSFDSETVSVKFDSHKKMHIKTFTLGKAILAHPGYYHFIGSISIMIVEGNAQLLDLGYLLTHCPHIRFYLTKNAISQISPLPIKLEFGKTVIESVFSTSEIQSLR